MPWILRLVCLKISGFSKTTFLKSKNHQNPVFKKLELFYAPLFFLLILALPPLETHGQFFCHYYWLQSPLATENNPYPSATLGFPSAYFVTAARLAAIRAIFHPHNVTIVVTYINIAVTIIFIHFLSYNNQ